MYDCMFPVGSAVSVQGCRGAGMQGCVALGCVVHGCVQYMRAVVVGMYSTVQYPTVPSYCTTNANVILMDSRKILGLFSRTRIIPPRPFPNEGGVNRIVASCHDEVMMVPVVRESTRVARDALLSWRCHCRPSRAKSFKGYWSLEQKKFLRSSSHPYYPSHPSHA